MKILMLGMLRRNGILTAIELRHQGMEVIAVVSPDQVAMIKPCFDGELLPKWVIIHNVQGVVWIKRVLAKLRLLGLFLTADLIFSRCLGAMRYRTLLRVLRKRVVEQSVGSDMRELPFAEGKVGRNVREYYRWVKKVFISQSDHLGLVDRLGLVDFVFLPLPVDAETYYPQKTLNDQFASYDLVVFHPARLDWTYSLGNRSLKKGNIGYRNSCKGNNKLIQACGRLKQEGVNLLLILLERGPDTVETRELVTKVGIDDNVEWHGDMSPKELRHFFCCADVVADQFDLGTLGLIALDAMMCEATVIAYLEEDTAKQAYGDLPPIINCRSEDEILSQLKVYLKGAGREGASRHGGRLWVEGHHGKSIAINILRRELMNI